MKITRIYTTEDGESGFVELDIPLESREAYGHIVHASNGYTSPSVCFVEAPEGLVTTNHNPPARQVVVVLSGVLEVETSNKQTRQWHAGGMLLADDVTGKGHTTRVVKGPVRLVYIPLPPSFAVERWSV